MKLHRIGQTEVCHLWNLVAEETREGDVYRRLLEKLEQARQALGGQVFDVLGKLQFEGRALRDLLIEAVRYGDLPEVRARLTREVEGAVDRSRIQDLLEDHALAHDAMDASRVHRIREDMERAEARRLQPHYIESFFREAFARLGEIALEGQISALPPVALGGVLVVPQGLLYAMAGRARAEAANPIDTQASAARAREIVMEIERRLGFEPTDREAEKLGYDIESRIPGTGRLRFLEVKGRVSGAETITVTRNEILYSLNKPDEFILAIVEFMEGDRHRVHYVRTPFQREPDFGVTSVNYAFPELIGRAEEPA